MPWEFEAAMMNANRIMQMNTEGIHKLYWKGNLCPNDQRETFIKCADGNPMIEVSGVTLVALKQLRSS